MVSLKDKVTILSHVLQYTKGIIEDSDLDSYDSSSIEDFIDFVRLYTLQKVADGEL